MTKYRCIYCLEDKEKSEFNREHVVPRMMGTYENGFVLNNYEVCEECNSYFSRELENKISLNSMESFLRIRYGRPISDGNVMKKDRLIFSGDEGVFKGLEFTPIVDSNNEEKMHFDIVPKIGILSMASSNVYNYYSVEELPVATEEIRSFLKGKKDGIIIVGNSKEDMVQCLLEKGYLDQGYKYSESSIKDLYSGDSFMTKINISIDSIVRRVCVKTAFNYLCYTRGRNYVLANNFDEIRKYIRYGVWSENLWFRYSQGPGTSVPMPNDTAHVVGYMLCQEDENMTLCGCLTWFGELTYVFKLGNIENVEINTRMACFDNSNRRISEDDSWYIYIKGDAD